MKASQKVIVVGAGPNGLAAAVVMAQAGHSVLVLEANNTVGGGVRSMELTLPGFIHDHCSAIHPLTAGSPFFRTLPLAQHGLEWVVPPAAVAHPFDDGTALLLEKSISAMEQRLGEDGTAYRRLVEPVVQQWPLLEGSLLGPPLRFPRHPLPFARFGLLTLQSASAMANRRFRNPKTRGFFAGLAAHAVQPLEFPLTSSFGLLLAVLAHVVEWPFPRGGAQQFTEALASYLRSLGGEIQTGHRVTSLDNLSAPGALLLDVTPRQLTRMAGSRLPSVFRRKMEQYRYGPGVFKLDIALDGPIPWKAEECARAATVHLGGTLEEIAVSERDAWEGRISERPFVLLAQHTLFDPTRAPRGKHTVWAYCHLPHASHVDMTERIEAQIERFAPGFRSRILARSTRGPAQLERDNANLIGGDIGGGAIDAWQLLARPTLSPDPYVLPVKGWYLCSSATPPGGGVHGMCGFHAAQSALKRMSP